MKTALAGLALAALLVTPAWADSAPRTLSMSGHGEVMGAPDQVQVNAGVTTSGPTAAAALAANTARMRGVFAALVKLGVPEKNIQTSNFSVSPQYNNPRNGEVPVLTAYQVSNEVTLRLNDVGRLGGALDALVSAGANQMNGISFSIHDPAPLLDQARTGAIADARARAQTYARAAGVTLGRVLSISEGGGEAPRPMFRMAAMVAGSAAPVAAGEQSISADVSVVWEIQ